MNYRGFLPKTFVTSLGDLTVRRRYYASRDCDCKSVPWDNWSGIPQGHKLSLAARRMVTLAGSGPVRQSPPANRSARRGKSCSVTWACKTRRA
jgi:hypothetical protein